ncbi:MAG TPA: hypothetical protein VGG28_31170 [Kofleriaceae bacterium]|jgi:hypothetical protein
MARLGWLGPAIVATGAAVACVGLWYMIHARAKPGDVIDTLTLGPDQRLVIRNEADGGERSFVELHEGSATKWEALIPHYVGTHLRPAVAWSPTSVTFRVQRGGRAEVFALAVNTALKLGGFRLAPEHEPNHTPEVGPITLSDQQRSYEFIGGDGWHQMVSVDLKTGDPLWKVELGAKPITDGGVSNGLVWVVQNGAKRSFDATNGVEQGPANHS